MAGENTIPSSQYPDQFQNVVVQLATAADAAADVDDSLVYYAERDTVIDAAFLMATASDADQTIQLKRLDSATTDPDSAGTAFSNAQVIAAAYTPYELTITTTENFIPAGSMVAVNIENAGTAGEITLQLRLRTRIK
tara:strand:+ start:104 stop:514 length:411 start_codon:yes stop_codon:yes gene_type:complete